jgi:rhodanese-related sulfurtransferase
MQRTISLEELKPLVERGDALLLDVRRASDYATDTHKIPNAEWKNPEEIAQWSEALPNDREIVVYCVRGGAVSNATVDTLQAKGFKARFIEGGIEAWKGAGGAVESKK